MQDKLYNTTIALAGMAQAASLASELAQTGKTDEAAFNCSINSIFQLDTKDTLSVYGNLANIKLGLEQLIKLCDRQAKTSRSIMAYIMSLIQLQNKITRSPKLRDMLKQRLTQTKKQVDYFSLTHPTVIANLADIYLQTISTFKIRIMIWGNPRVLNTPDSIEKIRALLLAGVRSAALWRQARGSRLQLLFARAKIKTMAENILKEMI